MIVSEVESIGGFIGSSVSEPLLQSYGQKLVTA